MITFSCFAEEWKCDDINEVFSINLTHSVHKHTHTGKGIFVCQCATPKDYLSCALAPCALFLSSITLFIILYTWGRIFHPSLSLFSSWESVAHVLPLSAPENPIPEVTSTQSQREEDCRTHKCQLSSWLTNHMRIVVTQWHKSICFIMKKQL